MKTYTPSDIHGYRRVIYGYLRPWWLKRKPAPWPLRRRGWLRYLIIQEITGGTLASYQIVGRTWTRRGARRKVDAFRRAQ